MNRLVLKSPAKLNLYLDVLRRRPDGYHDIETIFEKIALFDMITIRPHKRGIRITTDNPGLPTDRRNLVYKAVRLLFDKTGVKKGVWIDVKKNIPLSSGMGGGSSNAAVVLSGANKFFKLGLNKEELINLGRQLGADVPFFLGDSCFALGKGRGDEVSLYKYKLNIWHIVVTFSFGIATKEIYAKIDPSSRLRRDSGHSLRLTPTAEDVKILLQFASKYDIENLGASLYNKLEEIVLDRFDVVRSAKELLLEEGAYGAVLSGSGPTIFGLAKTREEATQIRERIQHRVKDVSSIVVVKTMNPVTNYWASNGGK